MRLISHLAIQNFRSLRAVELDDLESYSPIIGPNGSGKSNVFRALSLFFNNFLDEARAPLDLARDFPDTAAKKRRSVSVTVTFDTSTGYDARGAKALLVGKSEVLCIERSWSYAPGGTSVVDRFRFGKSRSSLVDADQAQEAAIQTFIKSIEFRYVPNHVRPAELIRSEIAPLQQTLMSRLRKTKAYKEGKLEETVGALQKVATDMLGGLSRDVASGTGQLKGIGADVPKDFSEFVFRLALNAVSSGGKVQLPEVQGSGTQTFILLHVLALLDSTLRGQGFGWRQSSIWAFEEPESFLHAGLRARFAEDLRRFAEDPRRQILLTSHQDEFIRLAEKAWLCSMDGGLTEVASAPTREALDRSNRHLITSYRHPLLLHPTEPIVLVEGPSDLRYISAGVLKSGRRPRWRLLSMEELEYGRSGGDAILTWLKGNAAALRSRPEAAPVFVLRDWEDTKVAQFDAALSAHEWSKALQCPAALANPDLDTSWKGIERFLPTALLQAAIPGVLLTPGAASSPISILPAELPEAKRTLASSFDPAASDPGPYLIQLAEWIDDQVAAAIATIPAAAFSL